MRAEIRPVSGADRCVRFRFIGDTSTPQWLARPRSFVGRRPDGDYLEFDPPVDYLGIEVKRRPYREHEMLPVEPGATVESDDVDLSELYELPEGTDVRVRYVGYHPLAGPEAGGGPFEPVFSEWVTLQQN
jgi:hypothetical protein